MRFTIDGLLALFVAFYLLQNSAVMSVSLESDVGKATSAGVSPASLLATAEPSISEKWERLDRKFRQYLNNEIKKLLPGLMENYGKVNISSGCMRDALKLISGLKESKVWAFSIYDASAKSLDGLLMGSVASLGEYDQCINTVAINEKKGRNYGKELFRGQYCAVDVRPPLPPKPKFYRLDQVLDELKNFSQRGTIISEIAKTAHFFYLLSIRLGICVPSGCSKEDIHNALESLVDQRGMDLGMELTIKRCEVKEEIKISPVMMLTGALGIFFLLLLAIGTVVDVIYYYRRQTIKATFLKVLVSFSFVANFQRLVNTKKTADTIACLNGIKALSMTWIILGHTYLFINYQIFRGFRKVATYQKNFEFQAVINASIAVDTFFFVSGLLLCYLTVKVLKEMKQPFNIFTYVFHRIWRLLPLVVACILIFLFITSLCSGPIWHDTVDDYLDGCHKNWWANLIFINNYINVENMCLGHTWYTACDMQLYLFSLVILLPLVRWPKVGMCLAALCVVFSVILTSLLTYQNDMPPTMLFVHPDAEQRTQLYAHVYWKPYPHAGPYCIGILVGYLLATKPKVRFSRVVLIVGWCSATICNLAVLYGVWDWNNSRDPNLWETIIYSGLHRSAWACGVAWVVICCAYRQGGMVQYILTWKAWVPISRLTYAAYLIHPIIQVTVVGSLRMKLQPSQDFAVWMFFGHLMVTYGASFGLSMLIEAPCLALEKIFLKRPGSLDGTANKMPCNNTEVLENGIAKKSVENKETHFGRKIENTEICRL